MTTAVMGYTVSSDWMYFNAVRSTVILLCVPGTKKALFLCLDQCLVLFIILSL